MLHFRISLKILAEVMTKTQNSNKARRGDKKETSQQTSSVQNVAKLGAVCAKFIIRQQQGLSRQCSHPTANEPRSTGSEKRGAEGQGSYPAPGLCDVLCEKRKSYMR